ncbi:MAG: chromosome segregation DNA-binding protein [Chthonomonadaceae bacterium]|nr:chromosome segregation DNA-binding protein [Chthonomonadaceae bacterium]
MEKRGLGRGLSALISDSMDEQQGAHVREIPLVEIVPNPFQPRTLFDPLKQEELVASIKEHGILQPILVRRVGHERYQLVAGERRFRAAQAAGLTTVPALIKEVEDRQQLEIAIVENLQREDIGVMEAARAYRRMIDEFQMTQESVAQRLAKSRSAIANTLRLLNLPEEVQDCIERGQISEGHGRALMMAEEPEAILKALQNVLKRSLSVRDTEKMTREMRSSTLASTSGAAVPASNLRSGSNAADMARSAERQHASDPNEMALLDELRQMVQTKVALRRLPNGSGRVEIEFYSGEDLARILEKLLVIR